ncbi:MAG: hypothetical protein ACYDCO_23605 [Armatimonadota bacterium]
MEDMYFDPDEDFILDLDDALMSEVEGTEWEEKVGELSEETPKAERIALYQQLRDAGAIPEDAAFFLITWAIETVAEERVDEIYEKQFAARFDRVMEEEGLDEDLIETMEPEELPQPYRELQLELAQAIDALEVATLQSFGEHKMAALYKSDPEEFDRRYDEGYAFFFGQEEGFAGDLDEEEE